MVVFHPGTLVVFHPGTLVVFFSWNLNNTLIIRNPDTNAGLYFPAFITLRYTLRYTPALWRPRRRSRAAAHEARILRRCRRRRAGASRARARRVGERAPAPGPSRAYARPGGPRTARAGCRVGVQPLRCTAAAAGRPLPTRPIGGRPAAGPSFNPLPTPPP